jgi:branched-chain amino acid transport system permease protein
MQVSRSWIAPGLLLAAALALPTALQAWGADYYLGVVTRIVVWALAATSLNLLLGYGGMVSLGHAAFMGLGGYTTAILVTEGVTHGGVHLLAVLGVASMAAVVIGAISLRTRGVHFIMITLALAQMLYFLAHSMKGYGGDEGLTIRARSQWQGWDLKDETTVYYAALAGLTMAMFALLGFSASRLGCVVQAVRDDELRAQALGFAVFRLKLAVFVVAGVVAAMAGALNVNAQGYVSPQTLHWTQSGTLMVMVVLGGVGTVWGGLLGAVTLILIEEALSAYTVYWAFWTGCTLLAVVLWSRNGLVGLGQQAAARLRRAFA